MGRWSWSSLSSFSNLRKIPGNLEALEKVSKKFSYNGKSGFGGLTEIFNGHTSAQKFIDNLKKADELVAGLEGIGFTGIKSSPEAKIVSKQGEELVKVSENTLTVQNKGWIDSPVASDELVSLPKNYEVYFANGDIFTGEVNLVKTKDGQIGFNYSNKNNIPFINAYSASGFKRIPKFSRPDPSTYLSKAYIDDHIKLFEKEGGAFIFTKDDISNPLYNSFNPKKYVMLKSDMDLIIAEYKRTGNLAILEEGLGYDIGALNGKEIYVKYMGKPQVKMPDGNEGGANKFWEPGGKTSGGKREAVLNDDLYKKQDNTNPIFHNNDLSGLEDVTRIK